MLFTFSKVVTILENLKYFFFYCFIFFEGFQYYELKLINNKEVARIILQNSYQKFKKRILKKKLAKIKRNY